MAYTFPLAKTVLSDILKISEVVWDIQRNDELSGSGDGRTWQVELAPPLWRAEVKLAPAYNADAKQVAAIIRRLNGAQNTFFLVDPSSPYPSSDPTGSTIGSSTVTINSISSDRNQLSLTGLPSTYVLHPGDKGQISYSSNPTRNYFFEVSETAVASGGGTTSAFEIFPRVALGISTGATVILKKPACKMFIVPESFHPGDVQNLITTGAAFTCLERR